jgi:hypothetical protein
MSTKRQSSWALVVATENIATIGLLLFLRRLADSSLRPLIYFARVQSLLPPLDGLDSEEFDSGKVKEPSQKEIDNINSKVENTLCGLPRNSSKNPELNQANKFCKRCWTVSKLILELRSKGTWWSIEERYSMGMRTLAIVSDWLMLDAREDKFLSPVHQRSPDILTVMLTGKSDKNSVNRAKTEANLYIYLRKLWNEEERIELVDKVLG